MSTEAVVESFWQARSHGVYFPPEWFDKLTLEEGCRVQLGMLQRRVAAGAQHIGWKVGLTSLAMQQQFNLHEPIFGHLLAEGVLSSPASLVHASLIAPGIENEMCVTLAADLAGPGVNVHAARAALSAIQPAMELTELRGPFSEQLAVAVGDNGQQKGIILGEPRKLAADLDLTTVAVDIEINGKPIAQAFGNAVLGDPINSVVWLANKLAEYGLGLHAGQLIMTGSLTRQYAMQRGDTLRATWRPFGEVSATFI